MSTTIRVSEKTRDRFAKLATATGKPMTSLLEDAADALEKQVFFAEFSERYAQLREDPDEWAEIGRSAVARVLQCVIARSEASKRRGVAY